MAQHDKKTDRQTLIRINKALASAGVSSRRGADDLVAQGRVKVNGQLVDSAGFKVDPWKDKVTLDDEVVKVPVPDERPSTVILLNKPPQVVTTAFDPEGRTTVLDLIPKDMVNTRVFPVGRLDFFSQGLLLLTDDGELTNRLTHPRWHLPKVYHVTVRGDVPEHIINTFVSGMTLEEGDKLAPAPTKIVKTVAKTTKLEMTLIQGVNRQIRRMCRDVGLTILNLKRMSQGPVKLGTLPEGKARFLKDDELEALRQAVGLESPTKKAPAPKQKPKKAAPSKNACKRSCQKRTGNRPGSKSSPKPGSRPPQKKRR